MKFSIFSTEFSRREVAVSNIIAYILCGIAYPFAYLFFRLGVTPNYVTLISLIFAVLAFLGLLLGELEIFCACWGGSIVLDYADGKLARATGVVGNTAFRVDHMTDQVKIALILLGVGFYHNETLTWSASFVSMFSFLYYSLINHDLKHSILIYGITPENNNSAMKYQIIRNSKRFLSDCKVFMALYRNVNSIFLTINGHTLCIFFLFALEVKYAAIALAYFSLLSLHCAYRSGMSLNAIQINSELPKR